MSTYTADSRITYSPERVFAPCYGTNHDHSRMIGNCPDCGQSVVKYNGRILDAREMGSRYARKFVCWSAAHECPVVVVPEKASDQAERLLAFLIEHEADAQTIAATEAAIAKLKAAGN